MARHRFFYLLSLARHRVYKTTDRICQEELGVGAAWVGALFVIADTPDLRQREVADALAINESAITGLLKRMEEAELVRRAPCADDGRVTRIRLTKKGRGLVRRARPLLARFNARLMDGFDDDELDVAARFLESAITRFDPEDLA